MKRGAGIVMPITSLPSDYGIGTMGKEARRFIDFLHTAKQTYWQILPLGPTSYGDSPYQSFSSFAGNPYLIDLDELHKDGLLRKKEYAEGSWGDNPLRVDYGLIYARRYEVLRKAVARLLENKPDDYDAFIENEKGWLDDYALFMTIKKLENGKPVGEWPKKLHFRDPEALDKVRRENAGEMTFWKAVQYLFFRQWKKLRQYAKKQNVKIIGDIPIYVAEDSVEVWADPKQFQLDKNLHPTEIAGCPPDGFAEDGQRWGNPLYDWEYMKKDGYAWWIRRVAQQFRF
ncbi:MAG: 4-alpha-glucanotransferase, partial [Erysipelotrichales bacterium]|nr:4-alpha-glucanotransferase [Erysipelotrichales bacterium]